MDEVVELIGWLAIVVGTVIGIYLLREYLIFRHRAKAWTKKPKLVVGKAVSEFRCPHCGARIVHYLKED